ncbi:MAG: hypothetical protein ABI397_00735 [Candidatus Saccharimonas sp.]
MTQIPEVRIQYSFLLSDQASEGLNKLWGDGTPLQSFEYYEAIAEKYAGWWQDDGDTILRSLCKITGLKFRQNIIDVHVAPWFYAFSSPMVLGVIFKTKDELVNTLTHEIIHRLLTDNTTYDYEYDFAGLWKTMLGEDLPWNALIHIPVHAFMQELYLDVLNRPDLLELDRGAAKGYEDKNYIEAWDYVAEHGYKTITGKIRQHAMESKS